MLLPCLCEVEVCSGNEIAQLSFFFLKFLVKIFDNIYSMIQFFIPFVVVDYKNESKKQGHLNKVKLVVVNLIHVTKFVALNGGAEVL